MNPNQIKAARIKVGLSQYELANKVGVSQPTISNWERGPGSPSERELQLLNNILGPPSAEDTTDASPLGAWLTKARNEKGFSIPELAHLSGLTPPAIYRIEAGITRNVRASTRAKLEKALGSRVPADAAKEIEQDRKSVV